jgi:hypothetical protein
MFSKGGYVPSAWGTNEEQQQAIQQSLRDLLAGKANASRRGRTAKYSEQYPPLETGCRSHLSITVPREAPRTTTVPERASRFFESEAKGRRELARAAKDWSRR